MTRDDLEFMRMVAEHTGRSPALAEREFRRKFLGGVITAAVISKPKLIIVSVNVSGASGPVVLSDRSGVFELADRSASAVRALMSELTRFASAANVREVYLRALKGKQGQYCPHGYNFKIETILQLVSDIKLMFVSEGSVGAWVRRTEPELPAVPSLGEGKYWDDKSDRALETALFLAEHAMERRYLWDGSDRNA